MAYDGYAEHNKLAAKLVAHQRLLGFLLSHHLKGLSPQQRATIEQGLSGPAAVPAFGDLDIETADDIAGLALDYRDEMVAIFRSALATIDDLAG